MYSCSAAAVHFILRVLNAASGSNAHGPDKCEVEELSRGCTEKRLKPSVRQTDMMQGKFVDTNIVKIEDDERVWTLDT